MSSAETVKVLPPRPKFPGPLQSDFAKQQTAKQQNNNYHSSSLATMMNVNQTNLHPTGVA